jgi:hypothetical protein
MKYPIFAFAVGGFFVEAVNLAAAGQFEAALGASIVTLVLIVVGSVFEACWNFK